MKQKNYNKHGNPKIQKEQRKKTTPNDRNSLNEKRGEEKTERNKAKIENTREIMITY